jgi:hypothetical protein
MLEKFKMLLKYSRKKCLWERFEKLLIIVAIGFDITCWDIQKINDWFSNVWEVLENCMRNAWEII